MVKRAMNRAPGPTDFWWNDHQATCGGRYIKVREPDGFSEKKAKQISKKGNFISKIPLIQPACDQADSEVLNILDYQTVPILTKFLQEIFVYCSCTWAVQLIRGHLHLPVQSQQDHLCFMESSQLN